MGHRIHFYNEIMAEANRTSEIFPSADHLALAFAEEAGEVVKAINDHMQGKASLRQVRKELIQAAAMVLRLAEEGDPTVGLPAGLIEKKHAF